MAAKKSLVGKKCVGFAVALFVLFLSSSLVFASGKGKAAKIENVEIGSYFADVWNGYSIIVDDQAAFLMRVGWVDVDKSQRAGLFTLNFAGEGSKYANGDLGLYKHTWGMKSMPIIAHTRPLQVGMAAADNSINKIGWKVGAGEAKLEWGRSGKAGVVGRITVDTISRITLEMAPAWSTFDTTYKLTKDGVEGVGIMNKSGEALEFELKVDRKPDSKICIDGTLGEKFSDDSRKLSALAGELVVKGQARDDGAGKVAMLVFDMQPGDSIRFVSGLGKIPRLSKVDSTLKKATKNYSKKRTWASGDWGDFVSPIMNNLSHSRLYNFKTHEISYTVSRRWSNYDGVVTFNWDTLFNALLGSLEDHETAKDSVRALLAAQLENGLLPNYSGPHWGVSTGRSQRSVGGMCAWKIYQRWGDKEFLAEVFPKLVKANDWWFAIRPEDGLPYRDGNRDGLLSCGEEGKNPFSTVYEGLDNSHQWDETTHSPTARSFRHAQLDISALWAADAEFLAMIADELGDKKEAARLRGNRDAMAKSINKLCWSEKEGMYCNRFWELGAIMPAIPIPAVNLISPDGGAGLKGEYFSGANFEDLKLTRVDRVVDFKWDDGPDKTINKDNFSVRWTGKVKPDESGLYIFGARAHNGVRLWVDNEKLIDSWERQPKEFISPYGQENDAAIKPLSLKAGKEYDIKIEYRQVNGPAEMILRWHRCSDDGDGLFSRRIGATNLYPLIAGIPDKGRGKQMIDYLLNPSKLWGEYVVPTVNRDDPYFNQHEYWRGRVWGPTNYLLYQGLKRYGPDKVRVEFARKSVALFMRNWVGNGGCWENYHTTGQGGNDPHYTWGALLCLIGLEEVCDVEPDGRIRLNGALDANLEIHNLRINGKLYDVKLKDKRARLIYKGKTVMEAKGKVKLAKLK